MEPRNSASPAPKTADAPKVETPKATPSAPTRGTAKRNAKAAKKAATRVAATTGAPKARTGAPKTAAKTAPKPKASPARASSGPSPTRIALAITVAKLRKRGDKWNEISAATGVSEPTLAKLRKDVRAGVFANVSPVAKRTAKGAF